jgi:hypothetical protein
VEEADGNAAGESGTDRFEREFDHLRYGRAKYFTRKRMRVGIQDTVILRISKDTAVWQVPVPDETVQTRVVPLKVYSTMTATLDGGEAFRIHRIVPDSGRDVQYVSRDTSAEWRWAVTPQQSGNHPLDLRATVVIDGVSQPYEVMHEQIEVQINLLYSTQQVWFSYWPWISSLLAALGGLGGLNAWNDWSERRRRRSTEAQPGAAPAAGAGAAGTVQTDQGSVQLILPRSYDDVSGPPSTSATPRWRKWMPWL